MATTSRGWWARWSAASVALWALWAGGTDEVHAQGTAAPCEPISTLPCTDIAVPNPLGLSLDFDGDAGGLAQSGFTMVLAPSVNRYPATPSVPTVPGYEPALLATTGGTLHLTATRGSLLATQAENAANNTQVNALGVGLRLTEPFVLRARLPGIDFPDIGSGEHAGLWFGLGEDNYVRLVLLNRTGAGAGSIELRREVGGVTNGSGAYTRLVDVSAVDTSTFTLELHFNPATNQVVGRYTSTTGETGALGPLTVPATFFAGLTLPDGSEATSFGGILASSRFNTVTPLEARFLDFSIESLDGAPVAVADAIEVAKGSTATVLRSGATSVLANDTDPDGDALTAVLVSGPIHGTLTLNANGTFSYTHNNDNATGDSFVYRVSDGILQSEPVTVGIDIVATCTPYTTAPCSTVPVSSNAPFSLAFDAPAGGLAGTGFRMVLPPSVNRYPPTPSIPAVPGYEPASLALSAGALRVTATRGSLTGTQTENSGNNTQVNALGVGVSRTEPFVLRMRLANTDFAETSSGEHAGLWFGLDEDNHVRLALVNRTGAGLGTIELRREVGGVTNGTAPYTRTANVSSVDTSTFTLELRVNPATNQVSAWYVSTTGESGVLGPLTVPASFFAGMMLPDGTGPVSVGGILASSRFNAGTPLQATFLDFSIDALGGAPQANPDAIRVARGTSTSVLLSGATSVLANDTDENGDALTAALVTGPANGTLTLNANGTFSYTHDNSASTTDSFTYRASDGLLQSDIVTVAIDIYTACTPYTTAECSTVLPPPEAPACLTFAAPAGGLSDTGFTANLPRSNVQYPSTNSVPSMPGYEPSLLSVSGGRLTMTSTRGSFQTTSNTQVNALGRGLVVTGPFTVSADVVEPPFPPTNFNEQTGIWFGADEDNLIRLAVINQSGTGFGQVELRREIGGVSTGSATDARGSPILAGVNGATFTLTLEADPLTFRVSGRYSSSTGASGVLGPLTVPASFFDGVALPDGTGPVSFAGIFATSRNNATTPALPFRFDNVCTQAGAPIAINDALTVAEGGTATTLTGGATSVLANDTDPENAVLTAQVAQPPEHGTLTLNANGTFAYIHDGSETLSDAFTYTASNGEQTSSAATVAVTVTPVNDAPVAVDDAYVVNEDTVLTVTAANRLTLNDIDAENNPLTTVLVSGPSHGTLTLNPDGTFTYAPASNFFGPDVFRYQANDGQSSSNVATVTLTVNPVQDAPAGTADAYALVRGGTLSVAAPGVLGNDSDPDGDALSVVSVFQTPSHGTLVFGADGSFTYTHNGNTATSDTFVYVLADTSPATPNVNVTVTLGITPAQPPVAVPDAMAVEEGGTATVLVGGATSVLANDSDPQNYTLTAVLVTGPAQGTLSLDPDGTFSYTHNDSEVATDSFTYAASNGFGLSAPVTVGIEVQLIGETPVAVGDAYTLDEDTVLMLTPAQGVLTNDTDGDGDTLTAVLDTAPAHGELVLASDGGFTYTPDADFNGADSFTYRAVDAEASSAPATVSLTVNAVADVPQAANDAYTVEEDAVLATTAAGGVLANDTDGDGDLLTAVLDTPPAHGQLVLSPDGGFTYTPDADFDGADSFTYRAADADASSAPATVALTVTAVPDAPAASADAYTVDEDAVLALTAATGVLANDTDGDGDELTAVLVDGPTHGVLVLLPDGGFTYTPDADVHGADSFTYQASDAALQSSPTTVTLTVTPVPDAPVAADDAYALLRGTTLTVPAPGVLGNDSDADGVLAPPRLVTGPAHGTLTLDADGSFAYTHDDGVSTVDSFVYALDDAEAGGGDVTATVTLTITNDQVAPVAQPDALSVEEGGAATQLSSGAVSVLANDIDTNGDLLTARFVTGPAHGELVLNDDGSFTYTHDGSETTSDAFTYVADDGEDESAPATVSVTVAPVNDAPTLSLPGPQVVRADATLVFSSSQGNALVADDVDAGGADLLMQVAVSHGTVSLGSTVGLAWVVGDGVDDTTMTFRGTLAQLNAALEGLTYTPGADGAGTAQLSVMVDDQGASGSGGARSAQGEVALTVTDGAPVTVAVGSPLSDGPHGMGTELRVWVQFDQPVVLDATGGTPILSLDFAGGPRDAVLVDAQGAVLTFATTVESGDAAGDLDVIGSDALRLNGATLRNADGVDADVVLPAPGAAGSLSASRTIVVDGVAPTVVSVGVPADGEYTAGAVLDFTVEFSEVVDVTGAPTLPLLLDSGEVRTTYGGGAGTSVLRFRYIVQADDADADGIALGQSLLAASAITDIAGNPASAHLAAAPATDGILIVQGTVQPPQAVPLVVPTLSWWGVLLLVLTLLGVGGWVRARGQVG